MDAQLASSGQILDGLWAEFAASVMAQNVAAVERQTQRVELARERMRLAPADVLAALGLDVEAAVWMPERGGQARVEGVCVWQGQRLETALWADAETHGRVFILVEGGGEVNALTPDVRAGVGRLLGTAVQNRLSERATQVQKMLHKAETFSLDGDTLANANLTLEKLPFLAPAELATVRQVVARRKWAARCKRIAERRAEAARRTAQFERALEVRAEIAAWRRASEEFDGLACTWAVRGTERMVAEYGMPRLWEVTFGARGEERGARGQERVDAEGLWLKLVVLEGPEDLAVGVNGLTNVTAVSWHGAPDELWIGPVAAVREVAVDWLPIDKLVGYYQHVECGEYVVNVPAVASEKALAALQAERPQAPPTLREWLRAVGFEREAETVSFLIDEGEDVAEVALTAVRRNWREG